MFYYSGNGTRKLVGLLSALGAGLNCVFAQSFVTQPVLTIGLVLETGSPITLSPLAWASKPVIVDLRTQTIHVRSGSCEFAASVVCSNQPVLAVQILALAGHTNEVEWTSDLVNWTPSNVRWVSDGSPVRYYIPQPEGTRLYRVRYGNNPPKAVLTVTPLATLPGVTNLLVISANSIDADVILDGSGSSDAENDPLQYAWMEGTNVFATTVKTTRRLGLGRHLIALKVNDGLAAGTASAQLETIGVAAAVDLLVAEVQLEEMNHQLRNVRPLIASLESAEASIERGHVTSGINQLQAFQRQVSSHLISSDQGSTNLIQGAEGIIRALTSPP